MRSALLFLLYLLSTPACLVACLVRDPLARAWRRGEPTYWIAAPHGDGSPSER